MVNKLSQNTRLIAEIGANHMGDMSLAKAMIDSAKESGADTVKFQSWQSEMLVSDFPDYDATFERHNRSQLTDEQHFELMEYCQSQDVSFLTTCFDIERVNFLASLGLDEIKVASPDCGSIKMIEKLMAHFPRLIISTGMTPEEEVQKAIEATRGHDVVFLHCVSLYPTPPDKANLARMDWLKSQGVRVGFSDHTMGVMAPMLAIARGAEIIEKHFTLSRQLPGKDQSISGEPSEFSKLAEWIECTTEMIGESRPSLSEQEQKLRNTYVGKWGQNN